MKKIYFNNFPRPVDRSRYESAIESMVHRIAALDGVFSVYQIGGISNPGISDIDLLVVFEEGNSCSLDPLDNLAEEDRYLFTHALYGVPVDQFTLASRYTFFHNYDLLWGTESRKEDQPLSIEDEAELKRQIALEFLVKMYINTTIELTYRIVKVRSLLLHVKALLYDMDFLGIKTGKLYDLIVDVVSLREQWFEKKPDLSGLADWIRIFHEELQSFLALAFAEKEFYVLPDANLNVAQNIEIRDASTLGYRHSGFILPPFLAGLGRRYFNIQHRFSRFEISIPVARVENGSITARQLTVFREIKQNNRQKFPHFLPLVPSLNIN